MTSLEDRVREGDPDRYVATLIAPKFARERLWTLYAFNLEISRAPWVTREPMIAEMRLQFWTDTLDEIAAGAEPRAHDVAEPLARVWTSAKLPASLGHAMIAARRWDIYRTPFSDDHTLLNHLDATSGNLMWLSAMALGAGPEAEATVRDMGLASGLANWFRAVPELQARGCPALPDDSDEAIAALARTGLLRHARSRKSHAQLPASAHPALLAGWQTRAVLKRAARDPAAVREGRLLHSEFRRRGGLLLHALRQSW